MTASPTPTARVPSGSGLRRRRPETSDIRPTLAVQAAALGQHGRGQPQVAERRPSTRSRTVEASTGRPSSQAPTTSRRARYEASTADGGPARHAPPGPRRVLGQVHQPVALDVPPQQRGWPRPSWPRGRWRTTEPGTTRYRQPRARPAPRQVGVLVVEEEPLVEQADLGQVGGAQQHGAAATRRRSRPAGRTGPGRPRGRRGRPALPSASSTPPALLITSNGAAAQRHVDPPGLGTELDLDRAVGPGQPQRLGLGGGQLQLDPDGARRLGIAGHRHPHARRSGDGPLDPDRGPLGPASSDGPWPPSARCARPTGRGPRRAGPQLDAEAAGIEAAGRWPASRSAPRRIAARAGSCSGPRPARASRLERGDQRVEPAGLDEGVVVDQGHVVDAVEVGQGVRLLAPNPRLAPVRTTVTSGMGGLDAPRGCRRSRRCRPPPPRRSPSKSERGRAPRRSGPRRRRRRS